uniref:Tyrosine aminotransferase n=1 Tax=Solanum tuberosum TaxID=4113 RepID=M1DY08_SOLTU
MLSSSRKDADSGRITVKFSRANGISDSIFGDWCSTETGENRRIAMAERDNGSGISSVKARRQLVKHTSYGEIRCTHQFLNFLKVSYFPCCSSVVLHAGDYEFADMDLRKKEVEM